MELDLGEVLKGIEPFAGGPAANDQNYFELLIAVVTQMQEGINALTGVVVDHKAQIAALQVEVRRLKARTDAPPRASGLGRRALALRFNSTSGDL